MVTIFELIMPGDCEGKSRRTVAYFTDANLADNIGKTGFGNMSMGPSNGEIRPIEVFETAEDFYRKHPQADPTEYPMRLDVKKILRERALAKLTPEERAALDLEEP